MDRLDDPLAANGTLPWFSSSMYDFPPQRTRESHRLGKFWRHVVERPLPPIPDSNGAPRAATGDRRRSDWPEDEAAVVDPVPT